MRQRCVREVEGNLERCYSCLYIHIDSTRFPHNLLQPQHGPVVVESLSHVQFFANRLQHKRLLCSLLSPRMCSNSYPFELMMPSNHLIFCHPFLLFPLFMPNSKKKYSMVGQGGSWNFTFPGPKKGLWIKLMGFPFGPCSKGWSKSLAKSWQIS